MQKLKMVLDVVLTPIIILGAYPLGFAVLYWQSAGFRYLSLSICIALSFLGIFLGFVIIRIFKNDEKTSRETKHLNVDSFQSLARPYILAGVAALIFMAIATKLWMIYVSVVALFLSAGVLLFYYLWARKEKKNAAAKEDKRT